MNGQDISVIGLPNSPVEIYNLYGMAFHETPSAMFPQFAEYKGYKFHCMTFKNKILREIQFTIINSNLEQAIGRARLLRNNCTVKVFARFPISQAETVTV